MSHFIGSKRHSVVGWRDCVPLANEWKSRDVSDLCNYDGLDDGERNVGYRRGRTDRRVQAGTPSVASEARVESNREELK
jgi:hypothetical protein